MKAVERSEIVAARLEQEMAQLPPVTVPEGVQLLNPGFFKMERLRMNTGPKQRSVVRAAINGQTE